MPAMPGMRVEVAWQTPPRARPAPNLLTVDQASFEASVDGWDWFDSALFGAGTLVRSSEQASDGIWSAKLTPPPGSPFATIVPSDPSQDVVLDWGGGNVWTGVPCTPGALYAGVADLRAETVGTQCAVIVVFFGAGGMLPLGTAPFGVDRPGEWATLSDVDIAPPDATHVSIAIQFGVGISLQPGQAHYIDRAGLLEGGSGHWALPGSQLWWRIDEADDPTEAAPLRSLDVTRGARMKVAEIETGEAVAVHDNRQRALDPHNAASPFAPHVKPRRRIRYIAETPDGGDYPLFEGFIDKLPTGWELDDGRVEVAAVDILSLIAGDELTHSEFELALLGRAAAAGTSSPPPPRHWWRLDEDHGRTAIDQLGGRPGRYEFDIQAGDPLLPYEGGRGNEFHGNDTTGSGDSNWQPGSVGRVVTVPNFVGGPLPFCLDAWVRLTRPAVPIEFGGNVWTDAHIVLRQALAGGQTMRLSVRWSDDPQEHGRVYFTWTDPAQSPNTITLGPFPDHPSVADGNIHHVRVLIVDDFASTTDIGGSLIVDGITQGPYLLTAPGTWSPEWLSTMRLGLHGIVPTGSGPTFAGAGLVAHVAWWDDLTPVADTNALYFAAGPLYQAGINPRAGELTGARIARVLEILGVDPADTDIHPGTTTCGPANWRGTNGLEYLRKVVATEQGALFAAATGRVTFRARTPNQPPITVRFAGDVDPLDPDVVPYSELAPPAYDLDRLVNTVEIAADGIEHPVRVDHEDSLEEFGAAGPGRIDTVAATASAMRSIGARLTSRHHEPRTVITDLQLASRRADVPHEVSLGTELGDAAEVTATPPGPGDPIVQTSLIERIHHSLDWQAQSWTTDLGVAEHVTLPTLAWDTPGRGWDQSVWPDPEDT